VRGNLGASGLACREDSCVHPILYTCMSVLVGFMVGVWVVFYVAVHPVLGSCVTVVLKLVLRCPAMEPPEAHIHHLAPARDNGIVTTPAAVELSVWIGLLGWGHPMSMRVWWWGIILRAVINSAASSDSAADAITNLMIWATESTAPLKRGYGSFSKRKICAPAQLQDWDSLRKPELACAHKIISLAR
jgi:hypothetical protein